MNENQEQNVKYRWKDEHKTSYINNLNSTHVTKKLNDLKGSVSRCDNVLSLERHVHTLSDIILTDAESCKLNSCKKSHVKNTVSASRYDKECQQC